MSDEGPRGEAEVLFWKGKAEQMKDHHEADRGRPARTWKETREFINSDHPCCIGVGDAVVMLHDIDALEKELGWYKGKLKKMDEVVLSLSEAPPALMTTPLGLLPVNSEGMRQLVDSLSDTLSRLKEEEKKVALLQERLVGE